MQSSSTGQHQRWPWLAFAVACVVVAAAGTAAAQSRAFQLRGQGVAHNANVNVTAGAHFVITGQLGGRATISGGFDNRTLFGSYTASGSQLQCQAGTCFQFTGTFVVGGSDGSGFAPNTTTSFTMTVTITGSRVRAIYHIGPLPTVPRSQYGTIEGTATR